MHSPRIASVLGLVLIAFFGAPFASAQPASPAVAPKAEAPAVKGLELTRPGGGKIGVELVGVSLRATFYDADSAITAPDAVRITARWTRNGARTAILLPAGEGVLQSPPLVHPPYNYQITLVVVGADDKVLETHTVFSAQIPRG